MARIRLDQLLTERGLARSRAEAQSLIHAGAVELDGTRRLKPGQLVAGDASVSLVEKPRWASRAGTAGRTPAAASTASGNFAGWAVASVIMGDAPPAARRAAA